MGTQGSVAAVDALNPLGPCHGPVVVRFVRQGGNDPGSATPPGRHSTCKEGSMRIPLDPATLDPVARELLHHLARVEQAATHLLSRPAPGDTQTTRRQAIALRQQVQELLEVVDAYATGLTEDG